MTPIFRRAGESDIPAMVPLINSAYRGDSSKVGWTTEADLLGGLRTTEAELRALLGDHSSAFLLCLNGAGIIGTVYLQNCGSFAYLGMFVVKPELQGAGLGRAFLAEAERYVQFEWGVRRVEMTVISLRHELIAYYERRGYRATGELRAFPVDDEIIVMKVEHLEFAVLEKILDTGAR